MLTPAKFKIWQPSKNKPAQCQLGKLNFDFQNSLTQSFFSIQLLTLYLADLDCLMTRVIPFEKVRTPSIPVPFWLFLSESVINI